MNGDLILKLEAIRKAFPMKRDFGKAPKILRAVDGVSFGVRRDGVFALVGESGCGKSTVARLILKLLELDGGRIFFEDREISGIKGAELMRFRRSVQIIFQDPFASLNPRMRIADTLSEPFHIHKLVPRGEVRDRVAGLLEKVGMGPEAMDKYPHEFSGGQRQRICIARALTVSPKLIIADEPLSALDVSIQAQILNLLRDIKKDTGIALVLISHDLKVVHYLSDEVGVMYLGRIVEMSATEDLFQAPKHPYTELLLASAPRIRVRAEAEAFRHVLSNVTELRDVPSPIDISPGCPFHPRCPKRFGLCDKEIPELKDIGGRLVSCHLYSS